MAKGNDLGRDPISRLVWKLAIPSMLAQLVNVLYGIVDRIYIGNIDGIGAQALAGVGVCGPIVTLITSFASLVGLGGAPLVAMRMGEGNHAGARRILSTCFTMLCALSALLTLVILLLKRPLLMAFGASPQTFPYADTYMTYYAAGAVFALLSVGLNQFIICQGYATAGMVTVVIGALLNIVLDPVFIFLAGMDVAGAALATVLSQAASCFFVLLFLMSRRAAIRLRPWQIDFAIVRRVTAFGLSPFIIIATDSVVIIALNSVLQRWGGPELGDRLVTCATIVLSYMQLITMPMSGLTGGTQPILSFNYGAKQVKRIEEGEKHILMMCVIFTGVMFLLSHAASHYFVRIFTQEPELVRQAVWGIKIFTLGIIPLAFQYTVVDGFTALGIARVAVTLSLLRKGVLFLLTVLLPLWMGAEGAFYAEGIADIMAGIVSTAVFLLVFRRLMDRRLQMPDGMPLYGG